jgi:hypothetical protein
LGINLQISSTHPQTPRLRQKAARTSGDAAGEVRIHGRVNAAFAGGCQLHRFSRIVDRLRRV